MKLTIGKKLIFAFLIIAVLFGTLSGLSLWYLKKIDDSYADLIDRRAKILFHSKDMKASALQQMSSLRDYLLNRNEDGLERFEGASEQLSDLISETLSLVRRDEDKNQLQRLNELGRQFKEGAEQVIALVKTDAREANRKASGEVIPIGRDMEKLADELAEGQQRLVDEVGESNSTMVDSIRNTVLILSIVLFVLSLAIGYGISRIVSKPIVRLANDSRRVASGDLKFELTRVNSKDELGELAESFNRMAGNLRQLISQVAASTEAVAASSEQLTASAEQTNRVTRQISTTIQEVASGADHQAQSVNESMQAVLELSEGARQISDNAQSVSSSASEAADDSSAGNEAIQRAVNQMNFIQETIGSLSEAIRRLGARSQQIGEIVEFITDIASQTNLLALNASIEAARAGEQGRGFAVVAGEIRKLAEQSAHSSREIADVIAAIRHEIESAEQSMEGGAKEVNEGISVVGRAGKSFEQIQRSVNKVATQIQEVAAAAQQMSASTEQIGDSMARIAGIVEESAAGLQQVSASTEEQIASSEEVLSSAGSLSAMAEQLREQIGRFKV